MESCNKDCWNCELEGCPFTLEISDEIETEIKFDRLRFNSANGSRYKRYRATPKGYKVKMNAKKKYEAKNPEKVALWQFKSRYKKKHGYSPNEEECRKWQEKRAKKCLI